MQNDTVANAKTLPMNCFILGYADSKNIGERRQLYFFTKINIDIWKNCTTLQHTISRKHSSSLLTLFAKIGIANIC